MDWEKSFQRADGLEVTKVADGYVVYHRERDRIHYLNHTAVVILELCTGAVKASEIPPFLQEAWSLAAPPTAEVEECLGKLHAEGIVE